MHIPQVEQGMSVEMLYNGFALINLWLKIYDWVPQIYNDSKKLPEDMPEEFKQHIKEKQSLRPNEVSLYPSIYWKFLINKIIVFSLLRLVLFGYRVREKILPMLRTLRHVTTIPAWVSPIITSLSKILRAIYRQLLLFNLPLKVSSLHIWCTYIFYVVMWKAILW